VVGCLGLAVDLCSPQSGQEVKAILQMNARFSSSEEEKGEGGGGGGTNPSSYQAAVSPLLAYLTGKLDYLATSRPTAVNLFHALHDLKTRLGKEVPRLLTSHKDVDPIVKGVQRTVREYAELLHQRDRDDCRRLAGLGAEALLERFSADDDDDDENKNKKRKLTVMTICNTGSLATSEYGTALGVIRALHERDRLEACIALETRPYNQGSRLTAYELVVDSIPNATLICDSMAASYLNTRDVDAVVVGADRVCANGDTANKVGTYSLAVLCKHHNVPFYVAAPLTTLDANTPSGSLIEIEQRPPKELIESSRAPSSIGVWNPAFDVTPAPLITGGIVTEKGVIRPTKGGDLGVAEFVAAQQQRATNISLSRSSSMDSCNTDDDAMPEAEKAARRTRRAARRQMSRLSLLVTKNLPAAEAAAAAASDTAESEAASPTTPPSSSLRRGSMVPTNYQEQTAESLPIYLSNYAPTVLNGVLQAERASDLSCVEFGDGNLNLVFLVTCERTGRQVIVKQALPYVRCVGESWPMTFERAYFEHEALKVQKQACPDHTPTVHYFSRSQGLIVMEYLAPPVQILRKGLIGRVVYPTVAEDMGVFCAHTLFKTSGLALSTHDFRAAVEFWSRNRDMCELTESVVFTEPYISHKNNRWTSPQLDADKELIENDAELKLRAMEWKRKFVTQTQALVHGDLHSGSVMCSPLPHQTYAIDPEFAFMGPMGFDTGAFVANLFLNYVSQPGHHSASSEPDSSIASDVLKDQYGDWVLDQIKVFWETFCSEFRKLWNDPTKHTGFLYGRDALTGDSMATLEEAQTAFLSELLSDTLGFAGCKMLRRVVGIAHVEDLESIVDPVTKVKCERHALGIAKAFIKRSSAFGSIDAAIELARSLNA
jgi:5-methylthioribose kinase